MNKTRRGFIKTMSATAVAVSLPATAGAQTSSSRKPKADVVGKGVSADFYVSPEGNDSDPGTLAKPFQSLSRARDAVFQLRRTRRIQKPVVVARFGGTVRCPCPSRLGCGFQP